MGENVETFCIPAWFLALYSMRGSSRLRSGSQGEVRRPGMGQRTKVPPFHWVLFALILLLGTFGSEGKKLQLQAGKSHKDNRDTNKWIPLSTDLTLGAQKEFELSHQKGNDLPIRFVDQALTKMPRDEDLVHKKKSQEDGILKRRHGIPQVICFPALLLYFFMISRRAE